MDKRKCESGMMRHYVRSRYALTVFCQKRKWRAQIYMLILAGDDEVTMKYSRPNVTIIPTTTKTTTTTGLTRMGQAVDSELHVCLFDKNHLKPVHKL